MITNIEQTPSWRRRATAIGLLVGVGLGGAACSGKSAAPVSEQSGCAKPSVEQAHTRYICSDEIKTNLSRLAVRGRAPHTGYARAKFGTGWAEKDGCDTRDTILQRDLSEERVDTSTCEVQTGILHDSYTGKILSFKRGNGTSSLIQIDHVVALGDAWEKGAQGFTAAKRRQLANDPLELIAVDGSTNEQKGDGDAATWLPPNKSFRCTYVAKQILVKEAYALWVTPAEHDAMTTVLDTCPQLELAIPD